MGSSSTVETAAKINDDDDVLYLNGPIFQYLIYQNNHRNLAVPSNATLPREIRPYRGSLRDNDG